MTRLILANQHLKLAPLFQKHTQITTLYNHAEPKASQNTQHNLDQICPPSNKIVRERTTSQSLHNLPHKNGVFTNVMRRFWLLRLK